MTKSCARCSKPFEAKSARAKYCGSTCRARASEKRDGTVVAGGIAPAVEDAGESPLASAVRAELEAAGRLDSALGQQALRLADRMESPFDSGAAVASLSRELRAVMDAALADAAATDDEVDELQERRKRKASSA